MMTRVSTDSTASSGDESFNQIEDDPRKVRYTFGLKDLFSPTQVYKNIDGNEPGYIVLNSLGDSDTGL